MNWWESEGKGMRAEDEGRKMSGRKMSGRKMKAKETGQGNEGNEE